MQPSRLLRRLKFRELDYLVTLGRISSIHRAAELHGITQPALSKTLRELEGVFGFKLFERSRQGVTPTKLGEVVIAQAVQMVSNLDALTARLDAERQGRRRIYRVGATPNPALRLIPPAFVLTRKAFPDLVIELVESSTDELLLGVRGGEYSLVVGRSSPLDNLSIIKQTPLYPEVGVVVGRAGHLATEQHHRKLQPLLAYPWILPQFGPTRSAIERAFMRAGCNPPLPSFINYAVQVVCDVLARTDALAVMPFGAVKASLEAGVISLVSTDADFQLPAYAMYKPVSVVFDPVLEHLERSIQQVAASLEESSQASGLRPLGPSVRHKKRRRTSNGTSRTGVGRQRSRAIERSREA
jgi:DNA-binding transcriptional LysR family regulator